MTTSPRRTFIGWTKPILQAATERLFAEHAQGGLWDLGRWLVVLPSSLAKRRLQELLALRAQAAGCILYPPEIVTVGQLPEHFYVAKFPFASETVQILAWCQALQQTDPQLLETVLPLPPRTGFPQQWLELGKMLSGVHRELASDRQNFEGIVAVLGRHPEAARWRALAEVQQRYLGILDNLGLSDVQTARRVALDRGEPSTDRNVLMLATVDLNAAQRGFISAVAEQVHVWIAAPEELNERFDSLGCLIGHQWEEATLDLPDRWLLVGNSPKDQFELTAACLAELGSDVHVRDVTIGVPDSSLIALLEQHLKTAGSAVRFGAGTPLADSQPARLLQLVGNYLANHNYVDLAALVRHPCLQRLITTELPELGGNWLADLDRYYNQVLPRTVDNWVNQPADGAAVYAKVVALVENWLQPLRVDRRPMNEWTEPLLQLFQSVYRDRTVDGHNSDDERLAWACRCVASAIISLADIPPQLALALGPAEAIDWLTSAMSGQLVAQPATTNAIELLGWLDLTLDDAPHLLITGMHDGVVPESVNADPFLPNQLRRQLGMIDNSRRYARDMYAFQVMLHSRQSLRVIVGRNSLSGDPLVPSRLLLACQIAQLPARVLRLTAEEGLDVLPEVANRWESATAQPQPAYVPPPADSGRLPKHLSVTAFRTYMACPYRFYLKHVCHLKTIDDRSAELDAGQFGDLIHNTLQRMHEDPIGNSTDAEAIASFLHQALEAEAVKKYGPSPAAAIRVQIAGAQERLAVFALKQAKHIAAGWVTRFCEKEAILEVGQLFAGKPLPIRLLGRIDRIDYHPATGKWAIWDYKTSDSGTKPIPNHLNARTGTWIDLQLPLYRHVVRALDIDCEPQVGYILIPKSLKDIDFVPADFSPDQLACADQEALRIIQAVAAGKYEPLTTQGIQFDDFARLCLVGTQSSVPPKPVRLIHDHRQATDVNKLADARVAQLASERLCNENYTLERTSGAPPLLPLMIRASAGTGKTYQLSNRLIQIILSGQSVEHVLATTFTRKAAGEILQRVLVRLSKACIDTRALTDLQQAIDQLSFDQADCLAALRRTTRQLHRFRVSTLDSFYAQVARTFSLELHLAPGWTAIDPVREAAVRMQAIQRMLDSSDQRTLNSLVKMLAKGDTKRSIAAEIEETVQGAYHYYRATDEAAFNNLVVPASPSETEFRQALDFLQRYDPQHKSIRAQLDKLQLAAQVGDWEASNASGLMNAAITTAKYYGRELSAKLIDNLMVLRQKCAAELLPVRRAQSSAAYELLDKFNSQYMALLRRQRVLAFADITYLLSRWLNPRPQAVAPQSQPEANQGSGELPMIRIDQQQLMLRMDCGIHHLLLDEFQDTAPDQWRIIEPLAVPLTQDITPNQSFFCVGDTKQAIYGWRGGVAEIFDAVTDSVDNLTEQSLSQSYRSSPEVIDVVNEVFLRLPEHSNFADCDEVASHWSHHFPEHQTTRTQLPGYVLVKNGLVCPADMPRQEKEVAELEYSADMIAELASQATRQNIGVLFRDNRKVALMIDLLRQRGVSASQEGGNPLTDSAAVQLILSLVHLADHPGDSIAAFHVMNSELIHSLPADVRSQAGSIAAWMWQQVTTFGLGRAISDVCDWLAPKLSWWEKHRLAQLITLAYQFETQFTHRLRDFEDFVQQQRVALPSEAQVKVMTIHSSKGLEFDAVFLPALDIPLSGQPPLMVTRSDDPVAPPSGVLRYMNENVQSLLPEPWRQAFHQRKAQSVREMLCVLYVAMTRARQALYVITAPRVAKADTGAQTCEGIVQSTLSTKELYKTPETVLYEKGTADWFSATEKPSRASAAPEPLKAAGPDTPARIALQTDDQRAPQRGYRVTSPSMLARHAPQLDNIFSLSQSVGAALGTLIHACFEQVAWLQASGPVSPGGHALDRDGLREAAVKALSPEELRHFSLDQELSNFERMLRLESVQSALSIARYARPFAGFTPDEICVENERRVSLIVDNQLIDGTIDRLVVLKHQGKVIAAEIIDYKTDRWDGGLDIQEWTQQRIEHHRSQLRFYAQVVSRMLNLPIDRIDCWLVLLSGDRCVRCDEHSLPPPHLKYHQLHLPW